jgi:hypothetical protein
MIYFMDLEGLLVCLAVAVVFSIISYLKGYEDGQKGE